MLRFVYLLSFVFFLPGCTALFLYAGATSVAVVATQERTLGKIIDDNTVWLRLKSSYEINSKLRGVSVSVKEGRVLLTGNVKESLDRMQASKIAWEVVGVREVINEIEIADKEKNFTESSWITAQVKLLLLMKSNIRSVNYSIETHDRVVYIMGIAQNKEELKRVIDVIRGVSNVDKIVSYVIMKDNDIRG